VKAERKKTGKLSVSEMLHFRPKPEYDYQQYDSRKDDGQTKE